jgi:hypothetical protein
MINFVFITWTLYNTITTWSVRTLKSELSMPVMLIRLSALQRKQYRNIRHQASRSLSRDGIPHRRGSATFTSRSLSFFEARLYLGDYTASPYNDEFV